MISERYGYVIRYSVYLPLISSLTDYHCIPPRDLDSVIFSFVRALLPKMRNLPHSVIVTASVLFLLGALAEASQQLLYIETKTGTDDGAGE